MTLNDSQINDLAREIARACEQAYRRGFEHGSLAGTADAAWDAADPLDVYRWRYRKDLDTCVPPPGAHRTYRCTALARLGMELDGRDGILAQLLYSAKHP